MKQTVDAIKEFKEIVKNDKRYHSMALFALVVLVVWLATDKWKPAPIKEKRTYPAEEPKRVALPKEMVSTIMESMEERKKMDEELTAEFNRMKNVFETDRKEINDSLSQLTHRVNNLSTKLEEVITETETRSGISNTVQATRKHADDKK